MKSSFLRNVSRAERVTYKSLRTVNDVKAVARGQVPRRITRRAYGRAAGRLAARLFR